MAIRIVQLGSPRISGEGLRIGTARRPPRGVPKNRYAADDWFDVWLPNLSPSPELIDELRDDPSEKRWPIFERKFSAQMRKPENSRLLALLAALSHQTNFSVGCYCADEARCHRSILRNLLEEHGATVAP